MSVTHLNAKKTESKIELAKPIGDRDLPLTPSISSEYLAGFIEIIKHLMSLNPDGLIKISVCDNQIQFNVTHYSVRSDIRGVTVSNSLTMTSEFTLCAHRMKNVKDLLLALEELTVTLKANISEC